MHELRSLPIGVFDSGLGGLTVLRSLRARLPQEKYIYLGDNARLPYGTKSQSVIREYARQCLSFLQERPVKAIVVACNTASSLAVESLREEFLLPIFGVIQPGVRAGIAASQKHHKVLVLGTQSTVKSETYLREFARLAPQIEVRQKACPLLVPLAEEGWLDHPITTQVIEQYLAEFDLVTFDTVVLGCTHFPLLEPSFRKVLPPTVSLAHAGDFLSEEVSEGLKVQGLLNPTGTTSLRLLSTDRISTALPLLRDWVNEITETEVVHLGGARSQT